MVYSYRYPSHIDIHLISFRGPIGYSWCCKQIRYRSISRWTYARVKILVSREILIARSSPYSLPTVHVAAMVVSCRAGLVVPWAQLGRGRGGRARPAPRLSPGRRPAPATPGDRRQRSSDGYPARLPPPSRVGAVAPDVPADPVKAQPTAAEVAATQRLRLQASLVSCHRECPDQPAPHLPSPAPRATVQPLVALALGSIIVCIPTRPRRCLRL